MLTGYIVKLYIYNIDPFQESLTSLDIIMSQKDLLTNLRRLVNMSQKDLLSNLRRLVHMSHNGLLTSCLLIL